MLCIRVHILWGMIGALPQFDVQGAHVMHWLICDVLWCVTVLPWYWCAAFWSPFYATCKTLMVYLLLVPLCEAPGNVYVIGLGVWNKWRVHQGFGVFLLSHEVWWRVILEWHEPGLSHALPVILRCREDMQMMYAIWSQGLWYGYLVTLPCLKCFFCHLWTCYHRYFPYIFAFDRWCSTTHTITCSRTNILVSGEECCILFGRRFERISYVVRMFGLEKILIDITILWCWWVLV